MSVVPRSAGSMTPDEAMRRYVDAIQRDIEPDPLFRRRLRGTVVNRFVAEREGVAVRVTSPLGRQMGRLGRACLYASFALALSVGGVLAASESAIPGDVLYPLKRSIEEMRMHVAPAHLRDDLAAYELGERLDELSHLVENGSWAMAATLAQRIETLYEELVWAVGADAVLTERFHAQLAHLDDVLDKAPVRARQAIVRAMGGAPGLQADQPDQSLVDDEPSSGPSQDNGNGSGNGNSSGSGNGYANGNGSGSGNAPSGAGAPGQADGTPQPEPTPVPSESEGEAERTPKPSKTPKANPTPTPEPPADTEGTPP